MLKTPLLVIGDVMLDVYFDGTISRISPEAPVPILDITSIDNKAGGAANVAMNIVSLERDTILVGATGKDESALTLEVILNRNRLKYIPYIDKNAITTKKIRYTAKHQQLLRCDLEEKLPPITYEHIDTIISENQSISTAIISDYDKGSICSSQNLIQLLSERDIKIFVDPKSDCFEKYKHAYLIKPNLLEFEAIVGMTNGIEDIICKAKNLISSLHLTYMLITLSENGMVLICNDGEHHLFECKAQEVIDVTGAGDTVIAVLASMVSEGHNIVKACEFANSAAGLVVNRFGVANISRNELFSISHLQEAS